MFCKHDCNVRPFESQLSTLHAVVQLWCVRLARTCNVDTIEKYLSAVNRLYTERGMPTPTYRDRWLKDTLSGLRRYRFMRYGAPTVSRKLPLTPDILLSLRQHLDDSYDDRLLWAMLCVGYFGFLRCAEMTTRPKAPARATLLQSHWSPNTGGAQLHIPYSKTDQYGHGVSLQLGLSGHAVLCPIRAVHALQSHPAYKRGNNQPLFPLRLSGAACPRKWFSARLARLLKEAGLDTAAYSGHSLRRGAASAAARAGVPVTTIMAFGRWTSMAFRTYLEFSRPVLQALSPTLISSLALASVASPQAPRRPVSATPLLARRRQTSTSRAVSLLPTRRRQPSTSRSVSPRQRVQRGRSSKRKRPSSEPSRRSKRHSTAPRRFWIAAEALSLVQHQRGRR